MMLDPPARRDGYRRKSHYAKSLIALVVVGLVASGATPILAQGPSGPVAPPIGATVFQETPDANVTIPVGEAIGLAPTVRVRAQRTLPQPIPPLEEEQEACFGSSTMKPLLDQAQEASSVTSSTASPESLGLRGTFPEKCVSTVVDPKAQMPSWLSGQPIIWNVQSHADPSPSLLQPVSAASGSISLFEDRFDDAVFDSAKWTIVNGGFGVAVRNGRLETTVQEQGATQVQLRSIGISKTFGANDGVEAIVRAQRDASGDGWVAVTDLQLVRSDDATKWVRIALDPWSEKLILRDSAGVATTMSQTSGRALGFHEVGLIITGSSYTSVFDNLRTTQASTLFSGASSFFVQLRDLTQGSTTGATDTTWRDYVVVRSFAAASNNPPSRPLAPSGPSSGVVARSNYYFTTSATDPDGNSLKYTFSWGDGTSTTTGFFPSGMGGVAEHAWAQQGTYQVSAIAEDAAGATSNPSESTQVIVGPSPGDAAEPDGDFASAHTITIQNGIVTGETHTIDPVGDRDFVKFQVNAGDKYQFFSTGSTDVVATLYDSAQDKVADDDDGNGYPNFRLNFNPAASGLYYLELRGYDQYRDRGDYSLFYTAQVQAPPDKPTILAAGQDSLTQGVSYSYSFVTQDPNGDDIRFFIFWGDGDTTTGWVASGATATATHTWSQTGTYDIWVRAEDTTNQYSPWSNPHNVVVNPPGSTTCRALNAGGRACDLVMLHGIAGISTDGSETQMNGWADLRTLFATYYNVYRATYYGDACGIEPGHDIANGNHGSHLHATGRSHVNTPGCNTANSVNMVHDTNENIEHLSYHTAWYLWNEFSSKGKAVDVMGHSMGGLVLRYASALVADQDPAWPGHLEIEDAITFGSPHTYASFACVNFDNKNHQTQQMCKTDPFMKWLRDNAQWPQPSSQVKTEWSLYGSWCDEAIQPESAGGMSSDWFVIYSHPEKTYRPRCYTHTEYYQDVEHARDAYYTWGENIHEPGREPLNEWDSAPHFGEDARLAALYDNY